MDNNTITDILTGLFTNGLWDFIKVFFNFLLGGVVLGGLGFLGYKSYNKNITIGDKSKVTKSFKSKVNQDIEIGKGAKIDDSFNS
ncbi:MAG: hypothetical protein PHF46_00810 [Candidatus Gracilibacteria bacterium]|nr:hypothetical protein [Candidatus Gracilibacteria bacterium]MDD3119933.1 hypothetical protein [Candidatus Gracilibacteria bacterium]MDD4530683.1 hypothetical protein [Candidatus Gracilibacteria bacterium]